MWTKILVPINFCVCFLFIILAIKGIFIFHKEDVFFVAECLQTCILMIHTIGKFLVLHLYKNNMRELLDKKQHFWIIDENFDNDLYKECLNITTFVGKIIRSYYYLNVSVCIFFDLQPFSTGYLPTVCYVPQGWFNYLTIVLWYLSFVVLMGLPGTDCFFCSLATTLIIQYKLLAEKFKSNEKYDKKFGLWGELKTLVDYHNFLLSYCKQLNATFRPVFLLQFMISIASASVSVFIFMQPGAWTNRIKFLLYFTATIIQTAFYCVPLESVVTAADHIADAVYESQWYTVKDIQFKKCLTIILTRIQKTLVFSAYGLVSINLRTFLLICKTVFSFYTYLNSINQLSTS